MIALGGWPASVGGSALVALVELDAVQVGQFMISRPLVLGSLLGLLFGIPQVGVALGLCCELFSIDDLPVGDRLPLNASIAVAAAMLVARGPRPLPVAVALPVGLTAGWAHQNLEAALRLRRRVFCGLAEKSIRRGKVPPFGSMTVKSLVEQAAVTFAVVLTCVLVVGPILNGAWSYAPRSVAGALGFSWTLAPWLGLGVALHALRIGT